MSSMFRKPKRNFRKKVASFDSDGDDALKEEDGEPKDPPVELPKPKKSKDKGKDSAKGKVVVSFEMEEDADEEDGAPVFKVKKSSHSRRMAKKIKRERQRLEKENDTLPSSDEEQAKAKHNGNGSRRKKHQSDDDEKIEDNDKAAAENLKKLREEFRTLNGEEAEAAEESDEDSDDQKAFKAKLARGEIPDARTIHFIRKQRQMARETDFIPVEEKEVKPDKTSTARLVRDDDNDKSEDEDDARMNFTLDKASIERQKMRDDFLAAEHGSDVDSDQEREWERQQIKKAVSLQIPGVETASASNSNDSSVHFVSSSAPGSSFPPRSTEVKPLPAITGEIDIESVRKSLQERLSTMDTVYRTHRLELDRTVSDMSSTKESLVSCKSKGPELAERYRFFQELRGYVRDLVECLNEKVPVITELEQRFNTLLKSRALRLVQRRQQDVQDQCRDYMTSKASIKVDKEVKEETGRQRRAAEREARRSRRRRVRESKNISGHHDGLSSDDEESSQSQTMKFNAEIEDITNAQESLFDDVVEEFSDLELVKEHFERWKFTQGESYGNAYIGLCVPKLLNPFIRQQTLTWNPLDEKCPDFEESTWYAALVLMGFKEEQEVDRSDDDLRTLPTVVEKILMPKMTFLVENVWDPLSTTQTARLVNLTQRLTSGYPNIHAGNKHFRALIEAVVARIRKTLDDDVFMPMYPLSALDNRSSGPAIFFHRQSWTCIKLLGNILSWSQLVSVPVLQKLSLSGLLNRYILVGLVNSHINREALSKCQAIVSTFPKEWFQTLEGEATLPQLENLCRYLVGAAKALHKASALDRERLEGRDLVKQISKHLINIHAMDHAFALSTEFSFRLAT